MYLIPSLSAMSPLNHFWKLTPFSEHSPCLRALWGWCSLRYFGEDTGGKTTLQIQKNSRRLWPRDGTCVLRYDFFWLSFLLVVWLFWRLLACLHSFLLWSIQQRCIEHLLCIRHFYTRHLQKSNGTHGNLIMGTCLPKWNQHVPNRQIQRKQEMSMSTGFPLTSHPITRYLLPSQAAAMHSVCTICFALLYYPRQLNFNGSLPPSFHLLYSYSKWRVISDI